MRNGTSANPATEAAEVVALALLYCGLVAGGVFVFAHLHLHRVYKRLLQAMAWSLLIFYVTRLLDGFRVLAWLAWMQLPQPSALANGVTFATTGIWSVAALLGYLEFARRAHRLGSVKGAWESAYAEL